MSAFYLSAISRQALCSLHRCVRLKALPPLPQARLRPPLAQLRSSRAHVRGPVSVAKQSSRVGAGFFRVVPKPDP
jgi:hypothetical protein